MAPKFASALRLITFDATGTLIKFKISPQEQYAQVGNLYGVHVNTDELFASFKLCWKDMSTKHPIFGRVSGLGWEKWWHELVCKTFRTSLKDNAVESSKFDLIAHHLIEGYRTGTYYELYPHVRELLHFLKNKNIDIGVISNNDDRLSSVIDHFGLSQYFSFILTSYGTGYEKPNCKIFEKALEFKNISPVNALHVGNSLELDYIAAKNCGWNAALVHLEGKLSVTKQPSIPSNLIFEDLISLQKFLS